MNTQPVNSLGSLFGRALALLVISLSTALAQPENKLKNDPTYSIHNYKHPNKAAAARAWESPIVLGRQARAVRRVYMGDYKRSAGVEPRGSRWTFIPRRNREVKPELLSGYNYKTPQPTRSVVKQKSSAPAKPVALEPTGEMPTGND